MDQGFFTDNLNWVGVSTVGSIFMGSVNKILKMLSTVEGKRPGNLILIQRFSLEDLNIHTDNVQLVHPVCCFVLGPNHLSQNNLKDGKFNDR